jgi:hypothetical protein
VTQPPAASTAPMEAARAGRAAAKGAVHTYPLIRVSAAREGRAKGAGRGRRLMVKKTSDS